MKKLVLSAITLLAGAIIISSCKKKPEYNPTPTILDYTQIAKLYNDLKPAAQTFSVTAGVYSTIEGTSGTKITFYPNSFKDASGNIITSGTVSIKMTEANTIEAMIRNRAFPVSTDGRLLRSGGEVKIVATMGGQTVYANKYNAQFKQGASSTMPMGLFYGVTGSDSGTTWSPVDSTTGTGTGGTSIDTSGLTSFYYVFDSVGSFNWINCDHFYGSSAPLTTMNIEFADTSFNWSNTAVYIVFPSEHSVMEGYQGSASNIYNALNIPVGISVKVFTMTYKAGNYYYSLQTGITVTSGLVVHPVSTASSLSGIMSVMVTL